jgi:hypothetical protein
MAGSTIASETMRDMVKGNNIVLIDVGCSYAYKAGHNRNIWTGGPVYL